MTLTPQQIRERLQSLRDQMGHPQPNRNYLIILLDLLLDIYAEQPPAEGGEWKRRHPREWYYGRWNCDEGNGHYVLSEAGIYFATSWGGRNDNPSFSFEEIACAADRGNTIWFRCDSQGRPLPAQAATAGEGKEPSECVGEPIGATVTLTGGSIASPAAGATTDGAEERFAEEIVQQNGVWINLKHDIFTAAFLVHPKQSCTELAWATKKVIASALRAYAASRQPQPDKTPNGRTVWDAIGEAERLLAETFERIDVSYERDDWFLTRITKIREALADRPTSYLQPQPSPDAMTRAREIAEKIIPIGNSCGTEVRFVSSDGRGITFSPLNHEISHHEIRRCMGGLRNSIATAIASALSASTAPGVMRPTEEDLATAINTINDPLGGVSSSFVRGWNAAIDLIFAPMKQPQPK